MVSKEEIKRGMKREEESERERIREIAGGDGEEFNKLDVNYFLNSQ